MTRASGSRSWSAATRLPVPGGQAAGVAEFAGGRVDQAGGADADGVQSVRRPASLRDALDQGDRLLHGGPVPVSPPIGTDASASAAPDQVGDDDADAFGADVERGQVGAVGDDPVDPGVRARAAARPTRRRPRSGRRR